MYSLINGVKQQHIAVADRGLSYGDGLFETVQVKHGQALLWDAHIARLQRGCERLRIPFDGIVKQLMSDWQQLQPCLSDEGAGVLKWTVTRGVGQRGYYPAPDATPTVISTLSEKRDTAKQALHGVSLRWCEQRLSLNAALAGIKHLNRLEQVLARGEWHDAEIAEGLMCDTEGYVVEGTMSNLLWVKEGVVMTPDLELAGIAGVVRAQLQTLAERSGLRCIVGRFKPSSLLEADEVMVCNSVIDIWPVTQIETHAYPVGPVTQKLQALLQKEYAC